ncbi:MAG TPA: type II toxin-antitoxin system VapB family antitoxin [Rhizomicrobium sp.]|jgi:hypothetical protein
MAIHITNPKADRLARKVAKQQGRTVTDAIIHALEAQIEHDSVRKAAEVEKFVADLTEIAKGATGLRKQKKTSRELIDDLYDENGLPR